MSDKVNQRLSIDDNRHCGVSIDTYNKLKEMWSQDPDYDESTFDSQLYQLALLIKKMYQSEKKKLQKNNTISMTPKTNHNL
jgi:hypothetical protein